MQPDNHKIGRSTSSERGIALFFAIFALLLLTAITFSLVFMSNTETVVNANYREEQIAYFAAKAGIEEARARMMASDPASINASLPIVAPTTTGLPTPGILYILNPGATANSVHPWDNSVNSALFPDDELCHDGYGTAFGTVTAPDVRCATSGTGGLPGVTTWYTSVNSSIPFNTTANALAYKWVRIAPKLNGTVEGPGTTATNTTYSVNTGVGTASTLVCWDGAAEHVLTVANCNAMSNANATYMNNVYAITSLAVSPAGARRMVQAEVALTPTTPFPDGLYATSNACPALTLSGNNASTNSYTTAGGGTYATTVSATGGDVGSNGGVSVGNGNIGGIVSVLPAPPGIGTCATPVSVGSNGSMVGTTACPSGNAASCYSTQTVTFPTPPTPVGPTNTAYSIPACGGKKSGDCMVPGTYGNISETGTLTLTPGVYNINSLSMTGNALIQVVPAGAVTINVAGIGGGTVVKVGGNGITDDSIPNDFVINYGGNGTVSIAGNGNVTAMLDAPNATVTQVGNGNWYGSILGSTISIGGNGFFHFDRNAALAPNSNGYYSMISYREISY